MQLPCSGARGNGVPTPALAEKGRIRKFATEASGVISCIGARNAFILLIILYSSYQPIGYFCNAGSSSGALRVPMLQLPRRATVPKARTRTHLAGARSLEPSVTALLLTQQLLALAKPS